MSQVDDCTLCLFEWNDWLESLPEMDKKRIAKRTPDFYIILLEDATISFDRIDWDTYVKASLKGLEDC